MPVIGQTTAAPKATQATPPPQAARPATPAPQGRYPQQATSFADAKPRTNNQIFLEALGIGQSAVYTVKVNRVVQKWANPRAVNPLFAQPTEEELATAQPAFKKKDSYIIECEILESTNPKCPPGYGPPSIVLTDKYPDSYMGDIKGFIAACFNAPLEAVTLDDWSASYKPDQPCAGKIIKVTVTASKNKSNEGSFTRHFFNAVGE